MDGFAFRTGLSDCEINGSRYLWTDAFAVSGLLELRALGGREVNLELALRLVDRVHHVLGRFRSDDPRSGWISGLSETEGEAHPTRGGLRIGKPLPERREEELIEGGSEWDRDGQYFHYATRWMSAIDRVSRETGDPRYNVWAREMAERVYDAFVHRYPGGMRSICWKMSTDLSRPLVRTMGQLDALDGYVTFCALRESAARFDRSVGGPELAMPIAALGSMCEYQSWATSDELGIGGLLTSASELVRLVADGVIDRPGFLHNALRDAHRGLRMFAARNQFERPTHARLAFRELGLAIGLRDVRSMRMLIARSPERFEGLEELRVRIEALYRYSPLADSIERFWMGAKNRGCATWNAHLDINTVMLVCSLLRGAEQKCVRAGPEGGPIVLAADAGRAWSAR